MTAAHPSVRYPEIRVVANLAGEWDATKAHSIISTVIQQNPDLCGVVGFWDVMDLGAAAAIKESGKPIALVTSGGGEQMACDNVAKGTFDKEIAYQVMDQGRDLGMINGLLVGFLRLRAFLTTLVMLTLIRAIVEFLLQLYSVRIASSDVESDA